MRKMVLVLAILLSSASAYAQPRPGAFTTLTTTDTSVDSLHVGCAVGSPSCTGGIKAGPGVFSSLRTTGTDAVEITSGVPGVTTNKLYNNSGNLYFNGVALATGSSVSGTSGTIAKFTGASTLGNSLITESGSDVTVTGTLVTTSDIEAGGSLVVTGGSVTAAGNTVINGGKIPAISSTYFTNLSGANLTGVTASALAAGTYGNAYVFSSGSNSFTGSGSNLTGLNASELTSGTVASGRLSGTYSGALTLSNASNSVTGSVGSFTTLGAGNLTVSQALSVGFYSTQAGVTTIATVVGNNNNLAIGNAYHLYLNTNAGAGAIITGMAGGVQGRTLIMCATGTGNSFTIRAADANSSAANRFTSPANADQVVPGGSCRTAVYDGVVSIWRIVNAS